MLCTMSLMSLTCQNKQQRGDLGSLFDLKSPLYLVFLFPFYWNKWFSHLFCFLICDFVVFVRRWFVRRLCATLFVFLVSIRYLIVSDCQISFDPVQIQSMTLASSTLQIRRHGYSGDLNIVIRTRIIEQ